MVKCGGGVEVVNRVGQKALVKGYKLWDREDVEAVKKRGSFGMIGTFCYISNHLFLHFV